jgi:predicted enzyme related to lactoylglutathione lyase
MKYPHGKISWTDLQLPDPKAATTFYAGQFGWEAEEVPTGEPGGTYFLFRKNGKQVTGIGTQPPEQQQGGIPPIWTPYVNVDDVDKIAAHAAELGATIALPPADVTDTGRIAFLFDPTGAAIGFWQPKTMEGAELLDEPGSMTWAELTTRDTKKATEFYTTLLPWEAVEQDFDGGTYTTFKLGDQDAAGMYAMDESWPKEVPAHWMVYFAVEDTDAAAEKIEELGGRISVPPSDSPYGRFSVVSDPQGGTFSIIKAARGS